MNLQALTVCIHEGPLLRTSILNRAYFDRWTVITVDEDTETQAVCAEFGLVCIVSQMPKLLGGAPMSMSDAGEYINEGLAGLRDCEWICLIGANVVLPREFRRRIEAQELAEENLYLVKKPQKCRADSARLLAQFFDCSTTRPGKGFFQLFHRGHFSGQFPDGVGKSIWSDHETQFRHLYEEECRKVLPFPVMAIKECEPVAFEKRSEWLPETGGRDRAVVIGWPMAKRLEELCSRMAKVVVVPKFDDAEYAELRRVFDEQTQRLNNVEISEQDAVEDGSADVLYLAGDVSIGGLCSGLLQWLRKLRSGGLICGDVYGFPQWPEATHTLVTLLGLPCGRGDDGFWWKVYRQDARAIPMKFFGDVVVFDSVGMEQMEPLILSLGAARKHWAGAIRVVHLGDGSEALRLACARYGAELTSPRWKTPTLMQRIGTASRELVMAPGCIAVGDLRGEFERRKEQMANPDSGWDRPARNADTVPAQTYDGTGGIVEFIGPPEEWSEAAWDVWCECEAEAASVNSCEIATAKDATVVSIVSEQDAGDFQRNWLSWRFAVPVVLVLVGIAQEEYWLPGSEHARVICVPCEQAADTGKLLKLVADACETERVIFVSPRASALPGAELWRSLPVEWSAIHFPAHARTEIEITENGFIPQTWLAAIPVEDLRSLASRYAKVRCSELSKVFCDWAVERESVNGRILFSDMGDFGWQFPGVYLPVGEDSARQAGDGLIRQRPDGLLQLADDVVVISLPERLDRRQRVTEMMSAEKVWFRFGDGVRVADSEIEPFEISEVGRQSFKMVAGFEKYLRGMVGCRRAHLRQLEVAKAAGLKSLLIIEDDMHFKEGWLEKLHLSLAEIPAGWMQLYFSASDFRPSSKVSGNLVRLGGAWQMTCVLYSEAGIAAALNCLRHSRCEIDHWMGLHFHSFGNSYVIEPQVTSQEGAVSDIMGFERGVTP